MNLNDGKSKVAEEEAPAGNPSISVGPAVECCNNVDSSCNNREVNHDTNMHSECISSDRTETRPSENTAVSAECAAASNATVQDCRISVAESVHTLPKQKRYKITNCLNPRDNVRELVVPQDLNHTHERSSRQITGRGLGDVTLNLTEFLSYVQRNRYDLVIPASRENRSLDANLPRLGDGCSYMCMLSKPQRFPRGVYMPAANLPDPSTDITNDAPMRNSVLAPNMYHPGEEIRPPIVDFNAPPPYEMSLKLPTYEEVQREKALEGVSMPLADMPNADASSSRTLSFLAIDADMAANTDTDSNLLGSDFMFAVAFVLALVFNWIGFLLLMCFCRTIASRYGALSGFGLSLAKWTIIVKNQTELSMHNAWLWWLVTTFGLLICVRALFQYVNIKRTWTGMNSTTQERLLFFY